ncbi:MAG: hypothetical protein V1720_17115 [bacterium]
MDCATSIIGIVYSITDEAPEEKLTERILKELIDRELYLPPDIWDLKKHTAVPLNEFSNYSGELLFSKLWLTEKKKLGSLKTEFD